MTLVRWRVQILSTLFVKEVGQGFSRSEGVAELLDETGVSPRGWIAPMTAEGLTPEWRKVRAGRILNTLRTVVNLATSCLTCLCLC